MEITSILILTVKTFLNNQGHWYFVPTKLNQLVMIQQSALASELLKIAVHNSSCLPAQIGTTELF